MQRDERGGIAVMAALSMTPLLAGAAIAIEFTNWGTTKVQLQRTADIAAIAAAQGYMSSASTTTATDVAQRVVQLNSLGSTTTVQVTSGTRTASAKAIKVNVTKTVPFVMAQYLGLGTSISLGAMSQAEVDTSTSAGGFAGAPACILALDKNRSDIRAQGSVLVNLIGCSLRSNADIATGGAGQMSASGFYASGTVSGDLRTGVRVPGLPLLADPYAGRTALQTAVTDAPSGGGSALNDKPSDRQTLNPGKWSSWDISGDVTLNPGLYRVAGNISLGSQAKLTGTGVTIIAGGSFSTGGGAAVVLTAATEANATNGAMAGIVFASKSTLDSSFLGNTTPSMTGVVYYPNGNMDFGGTAVGGSRGCLQVVAAALPMNGNPTLGSSCDGYNVATISLPPSTAARPIVLVQ